MPSSTEREDPASAVPPQRTASPRPARIIETDGAPRQFPGLEFPEAVALALVLGLAAFLRLHLIGAQSLWADEGNSWAMAIRPLRSIAAAVSGDIHPPLYYYLLNLWARAAGTSEAGLRALSALFGWLLVLATYLWARRVGGPGTALVAALCGAISPFAIYYSQEARAYALLALLATLTTLAFTAHLQARNAGRAGYWSIALYVVCAAAVLWTHYLGGAVLLLLNLAAFAWLATRGHHERGALAKEWLIAQAAVVALFAPWLPVLLKTAVEWPAISEPQSLTYYVREAARLYTDGPAVEGLSVPGTVAVAAAICGAVLGRLRRRCGLVWWLVVATAIWLPVVMWLISLVKPAYRAKFLLLGQPAFHVLVAAATVTAASLLYRLLHRPRRHPLVAAAPAGLAGLTLLAPLMLASIGGVQAVYYDDRYARDDYRAIAAYLDAAAGEGDAIILNAPGQVEVFSYYYSGPAHVYPLPLQRPANQEAVVAAMEGIARDHARAYAVLWATGESDPQSHVETWLNAHAYKATDDWYGNVRLASYELPSAPLLSLGAGYDLGGVVNLEAVAVGNEAVTPGTAWPVELHWRLSQPAGADYKLFLQALDANSSIVGQRDVQLLADGLPTSQWAVGQDVVDRQALPIYLGTPPGTYRVVAGLYEPNSGARLLLPDGSDHIDLGAVTVTGARPAPAEAIRPVVRARITLGAFRLLGWDTASLGAAPARIIELAPGGPLSVVLYWQVHEWSQMELEFALEKGGSPVTIASQTVLQGYVLPDNWAANTLARDPHILFVPPDLAPGKYRLSMAVRTAGGEGTVDLATVVVAP